MESPSVTCYPVPGKGKSRRLCEALARGAGGTVVEPPPSALASGPAVFYGTRGVEHLYRQARSRGGWWYSDNAFFDKARGTHFRVARDALQLARTPAPDWQRFAALGLEVANWTRSGRHVLVVLQSDYFLREVVRWHGGAAAWQDDVLWNLKAHTDRPIIVRHWTADKAERARTLHEDLRDCWALVTHMSAAANEALLAGVPVFVTGPCAALPMGLSQLSSIEYPRRPDGRREWAAGLCAAQWTLEELEQGAWWAGATS